MSGPVIGTPDWQRGVASAQSLMGSFTGSQSSEIVAVPPNAEILWVKLNYVTTSTLELTATGQTTSATYPVYRLPSYFDTNTTDFVVVVASVVDERITLTWSSGPGGPWKVIAESSGRFIVDTTLSPAAATPGSLVPTGSVQIAGTDGQYSRNIRTDQNGRLVTIVPDTPGGEVDVLTSASGLWIGSGSSTYFVFGVDFVNTTTSAVTVTVETSLSVKVASGVVPASGSLHIDLDGYEVASSVLYVYGSATGVKAYARYTATT